MQRFALCIFTLALAACSTQPANRNVALTGDEHVRIRDDNGELLDLVLTRTENLEGVVVAARPADAWALLPGVYTDLGLPAPTVDQRTWIVAVQGHTLRNSLGRQRLGKYLECGRDMTGDLADTDRIRLSVWTWLEDAGTGKSMVRSRLEATATSVEGRAGTTTCSSRGELERRIAAALLEQASR